MATVRSKSPKKKRKYALNWLEIVRRFERSRELIAKGKPFFESLLPFDEALGALKDRLGMPTKSDADI